MTSSSASTAAILEGVAALIPHFQERLREPAEFPSEEFAALARCGALAASLPRHEGGCGMGLDPGSQLDLLRILKEVGRGNQVVGRLFEGHVNALLLLHEYGSPAQITQAARDVLDKDAIFGVWNTGPAGQPVLERQNNGAYRLQGGKTFASGAGRIQRAIVTGASKASTGCEGCPLGPPPDENEAALLSEPKIPFGETRADVGASHLRDGWQMFVLPLDEADYLIDFDSWRPLGMESSDSYTVDFSGIEIGRDALLGHPDDYYREPLFTSGAFRFAAVQLGGAEALFDFCRDYLKAARYDQDPHQMERMGRMAVAIQTGKLWLQQAAQWLENGQASTGRDPGPPDERGTSADLGAGRESVVRASPLEASTGRDPAPPDERGTSADVGAGRESVVRAGSSKASTGRDPAPPDKRGTSADLGAGRESVVRASPSKDLQTRAHQMRLAVYEICSRLIELVEISIGARGLQGQQPFSRMLRDLQMYLRQAGHDRAITAVGRAAFDSR